MREAFSGGIGKVILKYADPNLTEADLKMLAELIRKRQIEFASRVYHDRKAMQKALEIEAVRKDIFGD
jgi:hypothetical protein